MTNTLNIAHRGGRSLAPENTLAAARKALEIGADMWELDVGVTADGELIVTHDDSLGRTTNVDTVFPDRIPWHFTTFTLSEIKQLDTASAFIEQDAFEQIAAGVVSTDDLAAMKGEPIPTLQEALRFTRDHSWRVNIEIKRIPPPMDSFPVADKVVALIEELDMVEQVLISSFAHSNIYHAKVLNPGISIAALLGFSETAPITWPTDLQTDIIHPRYYLVTEEKIRSLQHNGFKVNVWTVNDKLAMERFIRIGVNGIITDFPQVLAELL